MSGPLPNSYSLQFGVAKTASVIMASTFGALVMILHVQIKSFSEESQSAWGTSLTKMVCYLLPWTESLRGLQGAAPAPWMLLSTFLCTAAFCSGQVGEHLAHPGVQTRSAGEALPCQVCLMTGAQPAPRRGTKGRVGLLVDTVPHLLIATVPHVSLPRDEPWDRQLLDVYLWHCK